MATPKGHKHFSATLVSLSYNVRKFVLILHCSKLNTFVYKILNYYLVKFNGRCELKCQSWNADVVIEILSDIRITSLFYCVRSFSRHLKFLLKDSLLKRSAIGPRFKDRCFCYDLEIMFCLIFTHTLKIHSFNIPLGLKVKNDYSSSFIHLK